MRMLALGLLLALTAGCGSAARAPATRARTVASPPRSCHALALALTRLPTPTSMPAQRRSLARLRTTADALTRRFSVETGAAVEELSASLRAEHESISARLDGRVTASRRLHAGAALRYARGASLARAAAASCP